MKEYTKVKIVTKGNKHRVFGYDNSKWILIKEFKTLLKAINFTKKEGGLWL